MRAEEFRNHLDSFHEQYNREMHRYVTGESDSPEFDRVHSDFSDLHSLERVGELRRELKEAEDGFSSSRRKSLRKLLAFATEQHLESSVAPLRRQLAERERRERVSWLGEEIGIRDLEARLACTECAEDRRRLGELREEMLAEQDSLWRRLMLELRSKARGLGFAGWVEAREEITGLDLRSAAAAFESVLSDTEQHYLDRLEHSVQASLGTGLFQARRCDLGLWERKNAGADVFREGCAEPVLGETIARLGVQPEKADAIARDPGEPGEAVCIPIRVPEEIRVVGSPQAGERDCGALLHASGRAHHFAWSAPSLPAEHRLIGDGALSDACGSLLEGLVENADWLREVLGMRRPDEWLRDRALLHAYRVRHCIGRFLYAIRADAMDLDAAPSSWEEIMKMATGVRHDPAGCYAALAEGIRAAEGLRGWVLESMMREELQRRFGRTWYADRSAGTFLKEIWETGMLYTADELSREIGLGTLDAQALSDSLLEGLRR